MSSFLALSSLRHVSPVICILGCGTLFIFFLSLNWYSMGMNRHIRRVKEIKQVKLQHIPSLQKMLFLTTLTTGHSPELQFLSR